MRAGKVGRCSGCGAEGKLHHMRTHITHCELYSELFKEDPSRCHPPLQEYKLVHFRWHVMRKRETSSES